MRILFLIYLVPFYLFMYKNSHFVFLPIFRFIMCLNYASWNLYTQFIRLTHSNRPVRTWLAIKGMIPRCHFRLYTLRLWLIGPVLVKLHRLFQIHPLLTLFSTLPPLTRLYLGSLTVQSSLSIMPCITFLNMLPLKHGNV